MINVSNETRIKLNIFFAKAILETIVKAKAKEPGFAYHTDELGIDGYDYYKTPRGNGEVYHKDGSKDLAFQHYGSLGPGKSFFVQAVTNEVPVPTEFDSDSFSACTFEDKFNLDDNLKEIIIEVLTDLKAENIEQVLSILEADKVIASNKLMLTKKPE